MRLTTNPRQRYHVRRTEGRSPLVRRLGKREHRHRGGYQPGLEVWVAVDVGNFAGVVFVQFATNARGDEDVHVFADYLGLGRTPEANAIEIKAICDSARLRQVDATLLRPRWIGPRGSCFDDLRRVRQSGTEALALAWW